MTRRRGDTEKKTWRRPGIFGSWNVYQVAIQAAMEIFELSKRFPAEERYELTDQVRRSSRSVFANLMEAWLKRRYPAAFISKLSNAEAEAAETQVWLEMADLEKSSLLDQ